MKLKKIASLLLAGVMAVSMLAGCSTTGSDGDGEVVGEPSVPSTSDSATILHDAMKGDARKMTEPVESATLDTELKNAVDTYFTNDEPDTLMTALASSSLVDTSSESVKSVIQSKLVDAMGAVEFIFDGEGMYDDLSDRMNNSEVTTAVKLYAVEGSVSDTYALKMVAGKIEDSVAKLSKTSKNGEYNYTYTISASIVTKPVTSVMFEGITTGVKYIAVAVTQTPTKVV